MPTCLTALYTGILRLSDRGWYRLTSCLASQFYLKVQQFLSHCLNCLSTHPPTHQRQQSPSTPLTCSERFWRRRAQRHCCRRTVDDQLERSILSAVQQAITSIITTSLCFWSLSLALRPANTLFYFFLLLPHLLPLAPYTSFNHPTPGHHCRAVRSVSNLAANFGTCSLPQGNIWRARHPTGTFSVRPPATNHRKHA